MSNSHAHGHTDRRKRPGPLEYQTATPEGWIQAVAAWGWQEWRHNNQLLGWMKVGPCPRCGHTMSIYQNIVVGLAEDAPATVLAICNCEGDHPGRAETVSQGCGQQGTIDAREEDQ